jgi:hypothetical protein
MSEEALTDDQSHYEVSLTAGQAFLAFVLLLLSLAASFAFGLMIGRGQVEDRFEAKKTSPVVTEAAAIRSAVVAPQDDFKEPSPVIKEEPEPQTPPSVRSSLEKPPEAAVPHYAQLFSSSDQKAAENLAARLIDGGFTSAYVERGATDKGAVFRVRVKFHSEAEARAAEPKLRQFSKEVWITKQ